MKHPLFISMFGLVASMVLLEPNAAQPSSQALPPGGQQANSPPPESAPSAIGFGLREAFGNRHSIESFMHYYLTSRHRTFSETTAEALWQSYGPDNLDLLTSIVLNTDAAHSKFGLNPIPLDLRTFAAYGLGSAGAQSTDLEQRKQVVETLANLLEEMPGKGIASPSDTATPSDLQVAAIVSIGLIPLPFDESGNYCYCGTCSASSPSGSLQGQITYLARFFTASWQYDANIRTHTANTLANLVLAEGQGDAANLHDQQNSMKMGLANILIEALSSRVKQSPVVKISAILTLGILGDADDDHVDRMIRNELLRQASSKDAQTQRFALLSLADSGSQRGQGPTPWAGSKEIREKLMAVLTQGLRDQQTAAGLALGVLGYRMQEAGQVPRSAVNHSLDAVMRSHWGTESQHTFEIAIDLRKPKKEAHGFKLSESAAARTYAAWALGLPGESPAIAGLQDLLDCSLR